MVSDDSREKSVLFCAACGHESPPDGDWTVTERQAESRSRRVYDCPACGYTLESRRLFDPVPA